MHDPPLFFFLPAEGLSTCKCCDMSLIMTHWRENTWQNWTDFNYSVSMANTTKRPSCQVAGIDAILGKKKEKKKVKHKRGRGPGQLPAHLCLECVMTGFMRHAVSLKQCCCKLAIK